MAFDANILDGIGSGGARRFVPMLEIAFRPEGVRACARSHLVSMAEHDPPVRSGVNDKVHSAAKIVAVRDALLREGIPAEAALAGTWMNAAAPITAETRVSVADILRVYANAARLTASGHFAFHVGASLHVASYGQYGFGVLSATSFRAAIAFATKYHLVSAPLVSLGFEEADGTASWIVEPIAHPLVDEGVYRFLVEMQCGQNLSLHRDVMGSDFGFDAVEVTWPAPHAADRSAAVMGCQVAFGASRNRFTFAAAWLDREARYGNAISSAEVIALCEARLREIDEASGTSGRVRTALLRGRLLPHSIDAVADELGTSVRTLRRRLAAEGSSFREIHDDLRRDLALRLLQKKGTTVEEVAFALGFSDAANFRHAFRRWTNRSPRRG